MDLALYARVLWRFRIIVIVGFLCAVGLAFISFASLSFKGGAPRIAYRSSEQWTSSSTIFITQAGFALGRSVLDEVVPLNTGGGGQPSYVPRLQDPSRFGSYSQVLAEIAMSDTVRQIMVAQGPITGGITAVPATQPDAPTSSLPFVTISGIASSAQRAVSTARRATAALIIYMKRQQDEARIPQEKRVVLKVLDQPAGAALLKGRSKTRPIFVFFAAMLAVIGLAFVLENLRPRLRLVGSAERVDGRSASVESTRHSA